MRIYGSNRHLQSRDWRVVPRVGTAATTGQITASAAYNFGQVFTLGQFVYLANFSAANQIVNCTGVGGLRFNVLATTGQLKLDNASENVTTTGVVIPLNEWVHLAVSFSATRETNFYVNGELVFSAVMTGSTAWLGDRQFVTNMVSGSRVTRLKLWKRVLTRTELQGEYYSWLAPAADYDVPMNEGIGTTINGTADGVATTHTFSNMVWARAWDSPTLPYRAPKPFGYSVLVDHNGTGAFYQTATIPAGLMTNLRSTGITMAHWIKFHSFPGSSFRSMTVTQSDGSTVGLSMRFDCATPGSIFLTHNGRANTLAAASILAPASNTFNLFERIGRWTHVAITYDYAVDRFNFYINGILAYTAQSLGLSALGFHSDAVTGLEVMFLGALNGAAAFSTVQADHLIANTVATPAQLRALALYGVAPQGTIFRNLLPEGAGNSTVESINALTMSLTRGGTPITTAWRSDVP